MHRERERETDRQRGRWRDGGRDGGRHTQTEGDTHTRARAQNVHGHVRGRGKWQNAALDDSTHTIRIQQQRDVASSPPAAMWTMRVLSP